MANVAYTVWMPKDLETCVDSPDAYERAVAIAKLAARENNERAYICSSDQYYQRSINWHLAVEPDGTITEHV